MSKIPRTLCVLSLLPMAPLLAEESTPTTPPTAQEWIATPLVTAESRAAGNPGGEGAQWPQALEVAPSRPSDVYLGTDVGGVYRSRDGGVNWTPANLGLNPRGATDFAVDPRNPDRVLLVACNSLVRPDHGIWISENRGESWRPAQTLPYKGYRDFRDQVAFDPASYDESAKLTKRVYWSTPPDEAGTSFFYRSNDGGASWEKVESNLPPIKGLVRVHPTSGELFVGNAEGLFRSANHGASFTRILNEPVNGFDLQVTDNPRLFVVANDELKISDDSGATWSAVAPLPKQPKGRTESVALKVSPANPNHLLIDRDLGEWQWTRFVSHDGGLTWLSSDYETPQWETFIPRNNRPAVFVWHPEDPNVAWTFGGDFVTRSTDAGRTWRWSNSGYTGLMVGNSFTINPHQPNIIYVPSQDYDGAVTSDGGKTWKYINLSGQPWGGFNYGGYAFSPDTIAVGNRLGWGGETTLHVTRDGGRTMEKTGIKLSGPAVAFGHPTKPETAFVHDHRTDDGGHTWTELSGCDAVFAYAPASNTLIGVSSGAIVTSDDDGHTWTHRIDVPNARWIRDVALGSDANELFVVCSNEQLWTANLETGDTRQITSLLPADQHGSRNAQSVAVDPTDPKVVYAGKAGNIYNKDTGVARSLDGGKTWHSLTRNLRDSAVTSGPDGGREPNWLRVHPVTRELIVGTNCFGMWRFPAPVANVETAGE